ncbi:DsbA family protein [Psychrobacillus vulpis]|uniref:DsbA family protein n=2 Tax=Psychrobacillus vulpis TaxID=2325572 RepID=A0A544TWP2_9BACI|nr:DsbA family protein [Psychrobacillus vulpis]
MMCDLETGICGPVGEGNTGIQLIDLTAPSKKIDIYYVTDPICSHCWALEPTLRKFMEEYGQYFNMHTLMGGLLEKWDGFTDVSNGISDPADVAGHWREVGEHSRMPIDGSFWFEDPVTSSYIPSRVYKVIQQKDDSLAPVFLRRAREAVFPFNQNIGSDQILIKIINEIGLNGEEIVKESHLPAAQESLQEDFQMAGRLGVRGFPTIVFLNEEQKGIKVVGARPLENYIEALKQMLPEENIQAKNAPTLKTVLQKDGLLFSREIEELYNLEQKDVVAFVEKELTTGSYVVEEILGEKYIKMNK